jgi:hypothetical protein
VVPPDDVQDYDPVLVLRRRLGFVGLLAVVTVAVGCGQGRGEATLSVAAASATTAVAAQSPTPPTLARDLVEGYVGAYVEIWRNYLRDGRHESVRVHWNVGREISAKRWVVPMQWRVAGRLRTARWYVDLPLSELADQEVDLELTGKIVKPANATARKLSRLPSVPPAPQRSVAFFSRIGELASDESDGTHVYVALLRDTDAERYVGSGVGVIPLLRGHAWLRAHRVIERPRRILFDAHTVISVAGKHHPYSLSWLRHQIRRGLVEGAATWTKPPAAVAQLNRVPAAAFTIDPRFVSG